MVSCDLLTNNNIEMKNFEELKQAIKSNSFNESHLSNTQVVDLETVIGLIEDFEQCNIANVMPRFYKTKYSLEKLDEHIHELSCRTERWIHRGKLEDIEKLIRWRRRYDALNGA